MDVNDNAFILDERGALETIASGLAPTGFCVFRTNNHRKGKKTTSRLFTRDNVAPVQ
jgi:hypothetical protein